MIIFRFLLLFFFISNLFVLNGSNVYSSLGNLKKQFQSTHNFKLSNISFSSDVPFSMNEFAYLVNLKVGNFFTLQDLDSAYKQLKRKKRFNLINVELNPFEDGVSLHFNLIASWVFKKLDLKGVLFDKYQYEELYLQQPGDIFDISLHDESVKSIKKEFYSNGFLSCSVEDELIYEKADKFVTVKIMLHPGKPFKISDVIFNFRARKKNECFFENINRKITRKFGNNLIDATYSKKSIEKEMKLISDYLRKKGYLTCKVHARKFVEKQKNKVKIFFDINLGRKCKIKFEGNRFFSSRQIEKNILADDKPSWLFDPQIIAEQLIQEYYRNGFWRAKIDYEIYPNGDAVFKIDEGCHILITSIIIKDTKNKILPIKASFFRQLFINRFYDEDLFNLGLQNIKDFYVKNGFWDFKFVEKVFIKNDKSDSCSDDYSIEIIVDRGRQRFFAGIKIEEFDNLSINPFFKKYEKSKPFDISWIAEQRLFLLDYFQRNGYWYVDVNHKFIESNIDSEKVGLFVVWRVELGALVRFGKLLLRGNTSLPFKRILKELRFKEGDFWDKSKLDLTSSRLKKLDLFKVVQIQPYKISKTSDLKSVILTLVDDDPYEIRFRAGYFLTSKNFLLKQQSTYKLGSSFIFKNPTNSADKLLLKFDITRFEQNINADYQLPSPFGFPVISRAKAYSVKYIHPVQIGKSGSAYESIQNGFLVGLSNEYKRNYFWGLNIGDEWLKTSRVRGNLNFSSRLIDRTIPYFFVEPSLVIDTLDDKVNPTRGSLTFISLRSMFPHKATRTTFKIMIEQSVLSPIYKDILGGFRIRWGHLFGRDFSEIMPIERFYLGGPHSVRGYEVDSLPPLGVSEKIENGKIVKEYTIQGGSSMINCSIEARIPIFSSFGFVLFQDFGVLSQTSFSGFKGVWYPASGFGFRYKTPIGPIRFDIGWKWKKRLPGDCPYAWYLTIGEAF